MIDRLFQNSSIPVLQEVVGFTQARHGVLAGNIANVHTPGYRSRDLSVQSFQEALKKSVTANRTEHSASTGNGSPAQQAKEDVQASLRNILYHDNTNMDIEQQVVEISKNQYMHNLAVSLMSNQFQLLQSAISERV